MCIYASKIWTGLQKKPQKGWIDNAIHYRVAKTAILKIRPKCTKFSAQLHVDRDKITFDFPWHARLRGRSESLEI